MEDISSFAGVVNDRYVVLSMVLDKYRAIASVSVDDVRAENVFAVLAELQILLASELIAQARGFGGGFNVGRC